MEKEQIRQFFDECAGTWDAGMVRREDRIRRILDAAKIENGVSVLDVACGTGVLIPDYLARGVKRVTGVDLSPAMIACAKSKYSDPRVTLLVADAEETAFGDPFDRCVVYNAFPHFTDPARLIGRLSEQLSTGGRLTIAHGMSRKDLIRHHSGTAKHVSSELMSAKSLAEIMNDWFEVDVVTDDDSVYIVSGRRKQA